MPLSRWHGRPGYGRVSVGRECLLVPGRGCGQAPADISLSRMHDGALWSCPSSGSGMSVPCASVVGHPWHTPGAYWEHTGAYLPGFQPLFHQHQRNTRHLGEIMFLDETQNGRRGLSVYQALSQASHSLTKFSVGGHQCCWPRIVPPAHFVGEVL